MSVPPESQSSPSAIYDPYSPLDPNVRINPYPVYHQLRDRSPIHWSPTLNLWILTRYMDVMALVRDPRFSSGQMRVDGLFSQFSESAKAQFAPLAEGLQKWVLFMDPPRHTRLRSLINKAFTVTAVEKFRPAIHDITNELLTKAGENSSFDLIRDLAYPLPVMVIAEILGVPHEDRDKLKQWSDHVANFMGNIVRTGALSENAQTSLVEMEDYFRVLIQRHREKPHDDLLNLLISAKENGQSLSEDELIGTAVVLLFAGHETTTNLIGNGMLALLQHPLQLQKLRDEPGLVNSAVEESLRYDSPIQFISRNPKENLDWRGFAFAKGVRVFMMIGAANRDPVIFDKPDTFDITRKDNKHFAFGQGIHFCPGAPLARIEAQVAFSELLRRFPKIELASEGLKWRANLGFRGLDELIVRVTRSNP